MRFLAVEFDTLSKSQHLAIKKAFDALALQIESLPDTASRYECLVRLEDAFTWAGKAVRDGQIVRVAEDEIRLQKEAEEASLVVPAKQYTRL